MKLERNDKSMIFQSIDMPDIFFTDYLSNANGNYVKVYLYILFLSKYNKEIKLADLERNLNLPLVTIKEALKYWEAEEVLTIIPDGYIVNDLQQTYLNKIYKLRTSLTKEQIEKSQKSQHREGALEEINNSCFKQGEFNTVWRDDIALLFEKYGFDEEVMVALFKYCKNKANHLHISYVQAVADAWSKNNIKTYADLDSFSGKDKKLFEIKKSIAKKLGLRRNLGEYEEAYVDKWIHDFNYTMEIIDIALKRITSKSDISFAYIDKIISDWHDRNLTTVTDIEDYLQHAKEQIKNKKELAKKNNYNNYEQRGRKDLDDFYTNLKPAAGGK